MPIAIAVLPVPATARWKRRWVRERPTLPQPPGARSPGCPASRTARPEIFPSLIIVVTIPAARRASSCPTMPRLLYLGVRSSARPRPRMLRTGRGGDGDNRVSGGRLPGRRARGRWQPGSLAVLPGSLEPSYVTDVGELDAADGGGCRGHRVWWPRGRGRRGRGGRLARCGHLFRGSAGTEAVGYSALGGLLGAAGGAGLRAFYNDFTSRSDAKLPPDHRTRGTPTIRSSRLASSYKNNQLQRPSSPIRALLQADLEAR